MKFGQFEVSRISNFGNLPSSAELITVNNSGAAAIGNRKLRCRIGPSVDALTVANINDTANPHFIDSPYFTGSILVRVKNFKGITPDGSAPIENLPYFDGKKRLFSVQVSGRFKHEYTADDVVFGSEFERKVSLPSGSWIAMKFANVIDPALKNDVYADKPWLWSPALCSMNIVNVVKATSPIVNAHPAAEPKSTSPDAAPTKGPDTQQPKRPNSELSKRRSSVKGPVVPDKVLTPWLWGSGEELEEDTTLLVDGSNPSPFPADGINERRKYFQSEKARKALVFKPDNVYNFEIFAPFMNLNTFDLSLGISINLLQYLNKQPIRLISKSLVKNVPFFVIEFDLVHENTETDSDQSTTGGSEVFEDAQAESP
ncbi:hypothetical protein DFS34DRAFT_693906 [Phlyctochytrium arcticum]|nr:hypothetical protein DFS34DRAFT_693906 [Phlyctochytrium arcticum]